VRASASASANRSSGETDSTRTVRDTVRGSKQQSRPGIGAAIRRLFRQAVKALTDRDPVPAPKKSGRRRSGDDTGRRFTMVAARLTRMCVRPASAAATALLWLSDTLDWLDLWHPGGDDLADFPPKEVPNNDLSLRL
jgi:hypothetical protein